MAAILTDTIRTNISELFFDEVNNSSDSHEYYIGIGKSSEYPAGDTLIDPLRTRKEEREARSALQSVKKVTAVSYVIPRYNWTSGSIYTGYNDAVVGIPANTYYVLTEDNEVYICIQQGKTAGGSANTSTVKPSFTDAGVEEKEAFETSDGYRWKFLYAISATRANSFLSAGYLPVERVILDSGSASAFEIQQLNVQNYSIGGQITGIQVTNGGAGYSSAPTVTISGNGTSAAATATISGGSIVKIEMNNESAAMGSGYDYATVSFSGGGGAGAVALPIITSRRGIGFDPRLDLKSSSIMLNTKPDGTESGKFVVDQDFRQILVLRDIENNSGTQFGDTTGKALKYITMTTPTNFANDDIIRGVSSSAAAHVVDVDSTSVYYMQSEYTGYRSFADGELVEDSDGSLSGIIDSAVKFSDVDAYSGEVLYIENRARVVRSTDQTEDIKVIITV
jgi:hypothetical protein